MGLGTYGTRDGDAEAKSGKTKDSACGELNREKTYHRRTDQDVGRERQQFAALMDTAIFVLVIMPSFAGCGDSCCKPRKV